MLFCPRPVGRLASAAACAGILVLAFSQPGFAQVQVSHSAAASQPLLPSSFAGWTAVGAARRGAFATPHGATNAAVLKEFGLKGSAERIYQRNGSQMDIRALRFADATGAYGAYTFYRQPWMKPVPIGRGGAAGADKAVFWAGATMVEATLPVPAAGVQTALRALAARLPLVGGGEAVAPTLPDHLPSKGLIRSTVRYAIGPAAYVAGGGVLPLHDTRFDLDTEAVTARYAAHGGTGVLTLLSFPTPQMAMTAEKALILLLAKGKLPATLASSAPGAFAVKRDGPLVGVTSGAFTSAEARALLDHVKYHLVVTWSHGPAAGKKALHETFEMLVGIAAIIGVCAAISLILGTLFGGGRALWRIMHGKPASTMYEQEFISLDLNGLQSKSPPKLP